MAKFWFRRNEIWNQLKAKQLGKSMRDYFLIRSFKMGRLALNLDTLRGSPHKMTWKKIFFFRFCLFALTLTGKFIYLAAEPFLYWD